jgi:hypothetical protein
MLIYKNEKMNTLLFILISYGFSNIVVFGSIFAGLRDFLDKHNPKFFGKLFSCMICFPTWVGFLLSFVFFSPTYHYWVGGYFGSLPKEYVSFFFDGILASGTTWLIHTLQEMMERAFPND